VEEEFAILVPLSIPLASLFNPVSYLETPCGKISDPLSALPGFDITS
jgi:hypothetical protein